jgi:HEAT repeat protein
MKKTLIIIFLLSTSAHAGSEADSLNQVVDSLYIQATTKNINYQDQVQPAKEALGEMGEAAMPRLVEKMDTQDARSMHALVDIFKLIGRPAVSYVVQALGAEDPFKRRLAARTLGEMKDSTAVEGLLEYTADPDYRIRAGVINALGKIGDHRGVQPSAMALDDDDYLVRTAAAVSLAMLADSSAVGRLIAALNDPYYGVRYSAAEAVWKIGDPAVIPVLHSLKNHADTLAFYFLIEVAGNLKDERLIGPLERVLNSDDPFARAFAAEALGEFDTKKARTILDKRREIESHPLVLSKLELIESEE